MKLVIVESPTKARTITRFLGGGDITVLASMGHIRDLPQRSLGLDLQNKFAPVYELTTNGKRVIKDLKAAAKKAADIYLATDPDREGEAISWHLQELLKDGTKAKFHRVTFHEITREAIAHAFEQPTELDVHKVDAQQARRVLDRIVGYQVSPMLWQSVQKGTSAGRVQSVALRLICERQRAIDGFTPVEFWTLDAIFRTLQPEAKFNARLVQLDGRKLPFDSKQSLIPDAATANALAAELEAASGFRISRVASTPKFQRAPPPFITSTLQQAAGTNLGLGSGLTMRLAQELYEGVEIGSEGPSGLITYMRTDSVEVAREAQEAARRFVAATFGPEYVPERPNVYRSRQSAQGAHEAIRPTDVSRTPDSLAKFLSPNQLRLYRLIWTRFAASQMAPARLLENSIEVTAEGAALTHQYLFRTAATSIVFPGFKKVYNFRDTEVIAPKNGERAEDEDDADESQNRDLPVLPEGAPCSLDELKKAQKFTEPPKPYSEATLVKELEQNGIGRPSTYATIVETIQDREYVTKEKGRLAPTPLGYNVNDFLVARLPDLFQVGFTAEMESKLDQIEEGNVNWSSMLEEFYRQFQQWGAGGGGDAIPASAPGNETVLRFLALFPADLVWSEPEKRGRRTYDDRKFHESLSEQATSGKAISDKQWQAILSMAARYADRLPGLLDTARELGVAPQIEALITHHQIPAAERAATKAASYAHQAADVAPLLEAMAKVAWEAPVKRGRRTYDDKRFYKSLARQADEGQGGFSEPQMDALRRLAVKYHCQIPGFAELAARFQIPVAAEPGAEPVAGAGAAATGEAGAAAFAGKGVPQMLTEAEKAKAAALVALLDEVKEWKPATQRRGWTFDDRKFADSLRDQFAKRQYLSPKQLDALLGILRNYQEQIPDLAARLAPFGVSAEKPKPEVIDAKCPKCGAQMLKRTARGRIFYGCSAFPKCRHTANTLPDAGGAPPAMA